jgi:glycosyltransferase involved in cell wall biosynthesis
MADTLVFVPAWNEESSIGTVLEHLRERLPEVDLLVVDDGSTDETAGVARGHGAEVYSLGRNRGLRVPERATLQSDLGSWPERAIRRIGTCRARRAGSAQRFCGGRWVSSSGGRSAIRRAGCGS